MARTAELVKPRGSSRDSLFAGSLKELRHPPKNQISFLDGLRTFAVLLVINGHFSASFSSKYGDNFYSKLPFVVNGWIGVDLFFVLSGFFIGGQLWKELIKEGSISVRRFILRRGFRIWPLYFFTYFAVLLLFWHDAVRKQYGWADLVFLVNYINHGIVLGGWSLSTEEQFYILTPLILYWTAGRHQLRTFRAWLWALLAFVPLMRAAIWIHHTGSFFAHDPALFQPIYYQFHTHCDGLIMGLILSNLWVSRKKGALEARWKSSLLLLGGFVALVVLRQLQHEILIFSGLALFFGSLVWFGLTSGVRIFQSRVFYWISRLSFGMYLNHPYLVEKAMAVSAHLTWLAGWPVLRQLCGMAALTLASAAISLVTFCLVEHPFLNLRARTLSSWSKSNPAPPAQELLEKPAEA